MRIALGADHAGYDLKQFLKTRLEQAGHEVLDVGAHSTDPVDYPEYARAVAMAVLRKGAERGIMLGGSGQGESIAPNKLPGIRAALCHDTYSARMSRAHNDSNMLAMGARVVGPELAWDVVSAWLASAFSGEERHVRRLATIAQWERESRFPLIGLAHHGVSLWFDNTERKLLRSGAFRQLLRDGIVGVTSNPTIFEKAVSGSEDYDDDIHAMARAGKSALEITETLMVDDIRTTADQLAPVHELSEGRDGYASLELPPSVSYDTQGSVDTAKRLWQALDRPNVMIKVPGTREGVPAVEALTAVGVNVNITLLFSVESYVAVAEAYLAGLERRVREGQPLDGITSVASFFVSRIDTAVDPQIEALLAKEQDPARFREIEGLLGTIAIANAKMAYQRYKQIFSGPRWEALAQQRAKVQRLLWGSTGTKNPRYSDVLYVEELVGPDTVNTMPPATIDAVKDHGIIRDSLEEDVEGARAKLQALTRLGIDLDAVTAKLLTDGLKAFGDSYDQLVKRVAEKRDAVLAAPAGR